MDFGRFGPFELILILGIVILLFGPGRISKVAGEVGKGIKAFRDGLSKDESKDPGETPKEEK